MSGRAVQRPQRSRVRRRPRGDQEREVSDEISNAFDLVPEIGNGYRWYDWPWRCLRWLLSGWRRKWIPRELRVRINSAANWFHPFNDHQRNKVWSRDTWQHNVFVPPDEHVNVAGVWVVELFPPTDLPALERGLSRNGWVKNQYSIPGDAGNREMLARARSSGGPRWWRLADIMTWDSGWYLPGGFRSKLPREFSLIELRAIQVGAGLTAVVAEFTLTDKAATDLDVEWHKEAEPTLMRAKPRWRPLDRQFATYKRVQTKRKDLHTAARQWLGQNLPGFFTSNDEEQPLLDLLLFERYDPTALFVPKPRDEEIKFSDAFRALGLDAREYYQATSPDLPKLALSSADRSLHEWLRGGATWTLWGRRDAVVHALGKDGLSGYGTDQNRAIASRLVDNMYNLFVMLAVSEWLRVIGEDYATLRDRANTLHGRFRPSAVHQLRQSLLTLSLNLSAVRADVRDFWARSWRWDGDATFTYRVTSRYQQRSGVGRRSDPRPLDFNANLRKQQEAEFKRLSESDREYRDILSTAASLGASADSYKLGRIALWVAIVSLSVALVTVLVSQLSDNSVLGLFWKAVQQWLGST